MTACERIVRIQSEALACNGRGDAFGWNAPYFDGGVVRARRYDVGSKGVEVNVEHLADAKTRVRGTKKSAEKECY